MQVILGKAKLANHHVMHEQRITCLNTSKPKHGGKSMIIDKPFMTSQNMLFKSKWIKVWQNGDLVHEMQNIVK